MATSKKDQSKDTSEARKSNDSNAETADTPEGGSDRKMTEAEARKLQADATRPDRLQEQPAEGPAYGTKRADGEIEGVTVNVDQFKQPGEGGEGEVGDRKSTDA